MDRISVVWFEATPPVDVHARALVHKTSSDFYLGLFPSLHPFFLHHRVRDGLPNNWFCSECTWSSEGLSSSPNLSLAAGGGVLNLRVHGLAECAPCWRLHVRDADPHLASPQSARRAPAWRLLVWAQEGS